MLDFVYKGSACSVVYSKTNDEVPVVDIKGCQLENKNSFGFWGAIGVEGEALVNPVEASWVKTKVGRLNSVVVEKLGLNKWNSIQESDNPVLAFYRFK